MELDGQEAEKAAAGVLVKLKSWSWEQWATQVEWYLSYLERLMWPTLFVGIRCCNSLIMIFVLLILNAICGGNRFGLPRAMSTLSFIYLVEYLECILLAITVCVGGMVRLSGVESAMHMTRQEFHSRNVCHVVA